MIKYVTTFWGYYASSDNTQITLMEYQIAFDIETHFIVYGEQDCLIWHHLISLHFQQVVLFVMNKIIEFVQHDSAPI